MEFSKTLLSNLTMKYLKPDGFDVWLQDAQGDLIDAAAAGFWGATICVPTEFYTYACEYFFKLGIFVYGTEKNESLSEIELSWR